jgi:hypothetical protein
MYLVAAIEKRIIGLQTQKEGLFGLFGECYRQGKEPQITSLFGKGSL